MHPIILLNIPSLLFIKYKEGVVQPKSSKKKGGEIRERERGGGGATYN
jgi:hypothetical protein